MLPSGTSSASPVRLLSTGALVTFFDQLGRSDYDYVLVDGPPLLDLIDGQLLAQWVDGMLVVSRLDRLTPQAAVELHELLEQVDAKALGMVVVGSRGPRALRVPRDFDRRRSVGPFCSRRSRAAVRRRIDPAQISAATSQRCRQCSVSTKKLLARMPHQAPSSAAEPMPYVSRPRSAFRRATPSVKTSSAAA